MTAPVKVSVDDVGKLPVFAGGRFTMLAFRRTDGVETAMPLNGSSVDLPLLTFQGSAEYRVSVENLADGYVVRSVDSKSRDCFREAMTWRYKSLVMAM